MHERQKPVFYVLLIFLMLSGGQLYTQDSIKFDDIIIPGSAPFSLDAESAVYCINMLKNNRYLERVEGSVEYKIIEVEEVWSWFLSWDERYPEGHRRRYDIIVNGDSLDWDKSFIEYGGEMLNLRLLFLYRNQYPPEGIDYRNDFQR
ncbi:MAG: hypothetical protein PQJ61_09255 [Spirochaetales bacterium]|uniref:Uncharacterized protein n=1 Tax=Candidatus Thalassospirochaeta sargassi TaxID=3119039 RepID=A0AAJ1MJU4_9SPIO|nr:hypothetical protein [Spirochaetales bacterium]